MAKQYSRKFWVIFWLLSVIFLVSFWFFLQFKNQPVKTITTAINYLPLEMTQKTQFKSLAYFAEYFLKKDNREKTFLLLFQNDMELRPGGGYIGSFGIFKIKNGQIKEFSVHDLSNFDGRIPPIIKPPYPMEKTLHINAWKLRDSNWSPDFPTNAQKADYFYHLGKGQEKFIGVIAINTHVLASLLKVTGPIKLVNYPSVYNSENAILNLEYQVEKGYIQQGIKKGDRKSVMNILAKAILKKIMILSNSKKLALAKIILQDLNQKDIQFYFKNKKLEQQAVLANWSGEVDQNWTGDYLMLVDANLGSFKSDYYIKRNFNYTVDLSKKIPQATLKITYRHTGKNKDWMTKDYLTFLRIYVPAQSWLVSSQGLKDIQYKNELKKKYFGSLINIPLGESRTIELHYNLPFTININNYNLLIQKESGLENIPGQVTIINKNGQKTYYHFVLVSDWQLNKN